MDMDIRRKPMDILSDPLRLTERRSVAITETQRLNDPRWTFPPSPAATSLGFQAATLCSQNVAPPLNFRWHLNSVLHRLDRFTAAVEVAHRLEQLRDPGEFAVRSKTLIVGCPATLVRN
jgi:hypothetical protein